LALAVLDGAAVVGRVAVLHATARQQDMTATAVRLIMGHSMTWFDEIARQLGQGRHATTAPTFSGVLGADGIIVAVIPSYVVLL
jgi:hypothetical protein